MPAPEGNEAALRDDDLRRHVAAELSWDPQVDSEAIGVSADGGTVTLRGTVASLRAKRAAGSAAARVRGVTRVANELRVRLPDADRRADEDLRGDVLEALMLDVSVPMTIDAQARDGLITLTGTAQWHYQREAAESRTTDVPGVAGIDNAIILTQVPDARDAADAISGAFRRHAVLAADALSVETSSGGLVILSGTVSSWAAHDHAVAAAWSALGVTQVEDRIRVESRP
jgi:osmotically-inducible protein OsmY